MSKATYRISLRWFLVLVPLVVAVGSRCYLTCREWNAEAVLKQRRVQLERRVEADWIGHNPVEAVRYPSTSGFIDCHRASLPYLTQLPQLRKLHYSGTVTAQDLSTLATMPALQHLDLRGCYMEAGPVASLPSLPMLQHVDLPGGTGAPDVALRLLRTSPKLRSIKVVGTQATIASLGYVDTDPEFATRIEALNIISPILSAQCFEQLAQLPRLKCLRIDHQCDNIERRINSVTSYFTSPTILGTTRSTTQLMKEHQRVLQQRLSRMPVCKCSRSMLTSLLANSRSRDSLQTIELQGFSTVDAESVLALSTLPSLEMLVLDEASMHDPNMLDDFAARVSVVINRRNGESRRWER